MEIIKKNEENEPETIDFNNMFKEKELHFVSRFSIIKVAY